MDMRSASFTGTDESGALPPSPAGRVRTASASENDFRNLSSSYRSNFGAGARFSSSSFGRNSTVSRDESSTMFDVFFRRRQKDSSLHMIAEAVKEGVRDVVHAASGVAAATGIAGSTARSSTGSTPTEGMDSEKSFTSISDMAAGVGSHDDIDQSISGSVMTPNSDESVKTEYIPVHVLNKQKHFEGHSNDGPAIFVKSTRLSQTLTHHMGSIYVMEFSPDGKFLATAGEDSSLVIWSVGQKQYQPEEDDEYQGSSRPASGNFGEMDYRGEASRPESGNYSMSSFGYGYGTSSGSGSRRSSGNFASASTDSKSGSRDGDSDGTRSRTNSVSPLNIEDNEGRMRRGSSFSSRSEDSGEDYDDGSSASGSKGASGSVTSDLSGGDGISAKYGRSDSDNSRGPNRDSLQNHFGIPAVPKGTKREKIIDRDVIIFPIPTRVYAKGHTEPIVDISWSKSNFVLTASSDKTVSLWHVSQSDRLQFFSHNGIVTSVDFHPVHDRYFVSGCFDGKIRFWDVITNRTLDFILTRAGGEEDTEKVTCVKFSPDGTKIVAGFFGGKVAAYYCIARGDTKYELKYQTEFYCKDRAGRYMNGSKVTGLHFIQGTKAGLEMGMPFESTQRGNAKSVSSMLENYLLLVTTNDSNVRLVDWAEKTTFVKYKGGLNESLQTHATSSECYRFIITGTDDGAVIVWEMGHFDNPLCIQIFQPARPHMRNAMHARLVSTQRDDKTGLYPPVTAACFAPTNAVRVLLESAEDLYTQALRGGRERFDSISSVDDQGSTGSLTRDSSHHEYDVRPPLYRDGDEAHLSSLIMASADFEGNVRVYVREVERA